MTSQSMRSSRQVVGVFDNRQAALSVQQAIESAGIAAQKISIDNHVSPQAQVAALGTTTGGQAGFWMGAFYGGIIGVIAVAAISTLQHGSPVTNTFNQLLVIGLAVAGAIFGSATAKGIWAAQPSDQRQKGNPSEPRTFRLIVSGSQNEIDEARRVVRQSGA